MLLTAHSKAIADSLLLSSNDFTVLTQLPLFSWSRSCHSLLDWVIFFESTCQIGERFLFCSLSYQFRLLAPINFDKCGIIIVFLRKIVEVFDWSYGWKIFLGARSVIALDSVLNSFALQTWWFEFLIIRLREVSSQLWEVSRHFDSAQEVHAANILFLHGVFNIIPLSS